MDRFGAAPADRHAVGQRRPRCATEESVRQAPSQAAKPSERQCEHQCFSQFSTIKPGEGAKSRSLFVTKVAPSAIAWAAMSLSRGSAFVCLVALRTGP